MAELRGLLSTRKIIPAATQYKYSVLVKIKPYLKFFEHQSHNAQSNTLKQSPIQQVNSRYSWSFYMFCFRTFTSHACIAAPASKCTVLCELIYNASLRHDCIISTSPSVGFRLTGKNLVPPETVQSEWQFSKKWQ